MPAQARPNHTRLKIAFFIAALLVPVTAGAQAVVTAAEVLPQPDGRYAVSWSVEPVGRPVDLWVAASPDAKPPQMIRLATGDRDGTETVSVPAALGRPYFLVQAAGGAGRRVAERVLPLEGGRNFRDLGGYATKDGRQVRWGRVFRSGMMANLTPADYTYLSALRIRTVCDFRSQAERDSEPTRWQAGDITYLTTDAPQNMGGFREVMASGAPTAATVKAMLRKSYTDMLENYASQYAEMFHRLAAGETPLAFNCSAGKDRTGVAAALILAALGVPRETIQADYAMSDKVVNLQNAMVEGKPNAALEQMQRLPAEARAQLLASDPDYIEATLDHLDRKYGGVANYLHLRLGVTDAELAAIRAELLE